jgi:hypothetical protein
VSELATFLDRAPCVWFWRPIYRVFGSSIREWKALITSGEQIEAQVESRFAKIEATQRETVELLEQVVCTMLGDRQIPRAVEEMRAVLASELSKHAAEAAATNAAQCAAIEQLVLALKDNSNRIQTARNNNHASDVESAPRAGQMG